MELFLPNKHYSFIVTSIVLFKYKVGTLPLDFWWNNVLRVEQSARSAWNTQRVRININRLMNTRKRCALSVYLFRWKVISRRCFQPFPFCFCNRVWPSMWAILPSAQNWLLENRLLPTYRICVSMISRLLALSETGNLRFSVVNRTKSLTYMHVCKPKYHGRLRPERC